MVRNNQPPYPQDSSSSNFNQNQAHAPHSNKSSTPYTPLAEEITDKNEETIHSHLSSLHSIQDRPKYCAQSVANYANSCLYII
jgi:hypothetical protein